MRLFLIRHGETVDNVAGLYSGSRDSALTSHGILQARRLASHLAADKTPLKHIFSSNLQRAAKTADEVASEQRRVHHADVPVVQLVALREKDFGSDEGLRFGSRGRAEERRRPCDAETEESMTARVESFLGVHLLPLLRAQSAESSGCAIVAHGIILGVFYRSLCARVGRGGITVDPNPSAASSLLAPPLWDNTGYLECVVSIAAANAAERTPSLKLHIKQVNCLSHLKDLKKTRGGIGSAAYDDKQQTLTAFFPAAPKTQKTEGKSGEQQHLVGSPAAKD